MNNRAQYTAFRCSTQAPRADNNADRHRVIGCHERDLALSLELAADLAVQRPLVGFHCQQEVGPLLLEELKKGRCV